MGVVFMGSDIRGPVLLAIRDHIANNGPNAPIKMKDIAASVGTKEYNVMYHVKQLIKNGLMTKERRNNAGAVYYLTGDWPQPEQAQALTPPPAEGREDPMPQEATEPESNAPEVNAQDDVSTEQTVPALSGPGIKSRRGRLSPPALDVGSLTPPAPASSVTESATAVDDEDDEPLQYCTQCGRKVQPIWRFCGRCGRILR